MKYKDPYDFETKYGLKTIELQNGDICKLDENIDILVFSAFKDSYSPSKGSVIRSLVESGIDVQNLSLSPELDLRNTHSVWLSKKTNLDRIKRIAGIELSVYKNGIFDYNILTSKFDDLESKLNGLFSLISAVEYLDIPCKTIAIPLLGTHYQGFNPEFMVNYILDCGKNALEKIRGLSKIILVAYSDKDYEIMEKAFDEKLGRTLIDLATVKLDDNLIHDIGKIIDDLTTIAPNISKKSQAELYMLIDNFRFIEEKKGFMLNIACRRILELLISDLENKIDSSSSGNLPLYNKIKIVSGYYHFSDVMKAYLTIIRKVGNASAHNIESSDIPRLSRIDLNIMVHCVSAFISCYKDIYLL